jgi:alcohol dehydrogenase class IV
MTANGDLHYDFLAPRQIVFGWGRRRELAKLASGFGRRAFAVLGSRTLAASNAWAELRDSLQATGTEVVLAGSIAHEPTVSDVDYLTASLNAQHAGPGDWLLALGGGSALDLAKAAAALVTNTRGESVKEYLEGVGRGLSLQNTPLPMVAMPTTAGTGSEATKNAVISSYEPAFKKSLRSNEMLPRLVLVDPELTVSVPADTTAWTGMDAITQLIESYISRFARPIPQALCVEGLRRAWPMLAQAVRDGQDREAREAMSQAALLSGLALANSGLGLAHGVAAALGSVARVPHGLACAVMLPTALRVNREVACERLARLSRELWPTSHPSGDSSAADALIDQVCQLCEELRIPRRLSQLGIRSEQLDDLVVGSRGNSMNGNPRQLSDPELRAQLEQLL